MELLASSAECRSLDDEEPMESMEELEEDATGTGGNVSGTSLGF